MLPMVRFQRLLHPSLTLTPVRFAAAKTATKIIPHLDRGVVTRKLKPVLSGMAMDEGARALQGAGIGSLCALQMLMFSTSPSKPCSWWSRVERRRQGLDFWAVSLGVPQCAWHNLAPLPAFSLFSTIR